MFRFYTSTIVLICIVAQVLTNVPEGICKREVRKYQQVKKLSYRRCTTKSRFCSPIQLTNCLYYIKYYKCTYVQYLLTQKLQLTYRCCDGYYNKNDKCEKETVDVTPRTTCNTCLCNGTCTNDTESAISDLPVSTEVNKDEDTKCNTRAYNDSSFTNPTATTGVPNPEEGHHTEDESKDMSVIITVLLVALVVVMVTVIICWKVLHHRKQKNNSRSGEMEMQPTRNIAEDQNVAHGIGNMELGAENRIYFLPEPQAQDQISDEYMNDEFFHDSDSTDNPYNTVERRNRYSTEADPREDVDGQGVPDHESDIYHHLNRNQKETYNTDVYGILSGVELSQIQLEVK